MTARTIYAWDVCRPAVREGLIDPERSIQIGIRTCAPEDFGIAILDAYGVHAAGVAATVDAVRRARRRTARHISPSTSTRLIRPSRPERARQSPAGSVRRKR